MQNVGTIDRVLRIVIALAAVVLIATGTVTGTLAIVAGAVGAIMLLTGAISFCPLYKIVGLRTCPMPK